MKEKKSLSFIASLILASAFGIFLGVSPLTSMAEENLFIGMMEINYCQHNLDGDSGIANFCSSNKCTTKSGQGSLLGPLAHMVEAQ